MPRTQTGGTGRPEEIAIRQATPADIDGISTVRLSVRENATTRAQLDARGITQDSVAASLVTHRRGWVAGQDGRIVAFAIADRATCSIFALFALPEYEGRGLGRRLLTCAVQWLWAQGADTVWLSTDPGTRAALFYQRAGWKLTGTDAGGELRFELRRAAS